ncbi:MAG: hypothetical protein K6A30_08320 [Lachnospiraceae bacterium]|nr:hypothetical protein [Lachnospiraceae bacterium]
MKWSSNNKTVATITAKCGSKNCKKIDEYTNYIESLPDSCSEIKETWQSIMNEIDNAYNIIITTDWTNYKAQKWIL